MSIEGDAELHGEAEAWWDLDAEENDERATMKMVMVWPSPQTEPMKAALRDAVAAC